MKVESNDHQLPLTTGATFPGLHHHHHTASSLLTPSQLLAASQTAALMAASGLPVSLHATLSSNPGLFHPSLFAASHLWGSPPPAPTSPQSPPSSVGPGSPISPNSKARKHNINNNNIVSSSSGEHHHIIKTERRKTTRKLHDIEKTLPTVSVSPTSATSTADITSGQLSPPTSGSSPPSSSGGSETKDITSVVNRGTAGGDKQFICGVCKRSFGYKHVLQNHERTHTGEKPFECPECHKRFTRDHHLKTHMRLHTGERPYHCDHCDRHFVQVANLRRHLRVHTGERPYSCKECSARFSDSNQLKAHILIHKGEKPFHCERCQSRFRRRHHLMHHKCGSGGLMSTISIVDRQQATSPGSTSSNILSTSSSVMMMDEDIVEPEDLSKMRMKSTDIRRRHQGGSSILRMPSVAPLITLPLHVALPEQTEPEDLSMSTGHNHSHSSSNNSNSDSPLSRRSSLPSSLHDDDLDGEVIMGVGVEDEDELDEAATLFLKRHPHRRLETTTTGGKLS